MGFFHAALLTAVLLSHDIDAGTSCHAFQSRHLTEANPLLPRSCSVIRAASAGAEGAAVAVWAQRHQHPKRAAITLVGMLILPAYAAQHNLRVLRR